MSEVFDAFRECAGAGNVKPVEHLLADDVRLFASLTGKPFEGKETVLAVLTMLLEVFDDLSYIAEYQGPAGLTMTSTGSIGGRSADGVQVLTFDADGHVAEFRDFVRPLSAAKALLAAADAYFAGPRDTDQLQGS